MGNDRDEGGPYKIQGSYSRKEDTQATRSQERPTLRGGSKIRVGKRIRKNGFESVQDLSGKTGRVTNSE